MLADVKYAKMNGNGRNIWPSPRRACILAMGRATPPHCIHQRTYADFYFKATNSEHKTELKKKFARICERSGIETRYSILTEEFLKEHPEFYTDRKPSLEERNAIFNEEVPKLAHEAASEALHEWGRPATDITHLIVTTLTGVAIPGADVALVQSLGLRPDVNRIMLYMLGCYAGVTALRIAKDLAVADPNARILVCCSELAAPTFRAPNDDHPYDLVGTALFGDAAAGVIVGCVPIITTEMDLGCMPSRVANDDPIPGLADCDWVGGDTCTAANSSCFANSSTCSPRIAMFGKGDERPLYEILWTGEVLIPESKRVIEGKLTLDGLQFYLDRSLPSLVGAHVWNFCHKALMHVSRMLLTTCARDRLHYNSPSNDDFNSHLYQQDRNSSVNVAKHSDANPINDKHNGSKANASLKAAAANHDINGYCDDHCLNNDINNNVDSNNDSNGGGDACLSFNDVFWAVHSGGPAILNAVEQALGLQPSKLAASRDILRRYGNVSASTVLFVLDELRSCRPGIHAHADPSAFGIALAFGPGVTIEGAVLRKLVN